MAGRYHRFLLSMIVLAAASAAAAGATITSIAPNSTSILKYGRYELNFNLSGVSPANYNPFRPDTTADSLSPAGVNVWATVTSPSGVSTKVWGYWDVDFDYLGTIGDYGQGWTKYDKFVPASAPHWRIRYSPSELGNYSVQIHATDLGGTASSASQAFSCIDSSLKGFVKISSDGQRLVYSSGDPYVAMGTSAADSAGQTSSLANMSANGMTFERRWVTNSVAADIYRESYPETWTLTNASYDTSTAHTGTRSVLRQVTGSGVFLEEPFIGVRNGANYQASLWLKGNSTFKGTAAVQVKIRYTDGSIKTFTGKSVTGTLWSQSKLNFTTSASGKTADFISVYGIIVSGTSGSVWADDAELYETNSDGSIKVNYNYLWNPSFEQWSPARLRLIALWRLERLLAVAEQNGIAVQPCIFDYRLWNTVSPTGFYTNHYGDFWSNTAATSQEDRVLRYLVARYSTYRSLFAWELTNESDPTYTDSRMKWISDRASFIKENDPQKHPVTNSYWTSPGEARYAQSNVTDINQVHYYLNTEERAGGQGVPTWWTMPSGMAIDRNAGNAHTGTSSMKLSANGSTVYKTLPLYLKPNSSYSFRFWKKASGLNGNAGVIVRFYGIGGSEDKSSFSKISSTNSGYVQQQNDFVTPADCYRITITPQLTGSTGSAWLDDIEVIDNATGRNILYNGGFESGNFGDDEFEWAFYNTYSTRQMYESGPNPTKKPWISGEFGLMGANADLSKWADPTSNYPRHDTKGLHLHNCLWAQFTAGSALGTPTYWWVSEYVNNYNLLPVWKGLTQFSTELPFYDRGTSISTAPYPADIQAQTTNPTIRALGQKKGNQAYLWIQNSQDTWSRVIRSGINPSPASSNITLGGFDNGTYGVSWYDTYTGVLIRTDAVSVTDNTMTLSVSNLSTDVAVTIGAVVKPNIRLTITTDKTTAKPSEVIRYTLSYTNSGGPADNVSLTLPVPGFTTYLSGSATGGGVYNATLKLMTWTIPTIAAGASGSVSASAVVN